MKISAVLSIHNRSELFKRAIDGYLYQSMSPTDWEIILIDDMSTEDLSQTYQHVIGDINLRHIKIDHRRHPIWKEMNPKGTEGAFENWYHTPAITINLGCHLARGSVICLCHPEILHAPWNFVNAFSTIQKKPGFLFGKTYLGRPAMNVHLSKIKSWSSLGWEWFLNKMRTIEHLGNFGPTELYWYTSFLPKEAVGIVGGVDLEYCRGAAAEDDDFRDRVALAGCLPRYFPEAEGFHQDHSNEQEKHRDRTSKHWFDGLTKNRALYYYRKDNKKYPTKANVNYDWTCLETKISETEYKIGSKVPIEHV